MEPHPRQRLLLLLLLVLLSSGVSYIHACGRVPDATHLCCPPIMNFVSPPLPPDAFPSRNTSTSKHSWQFRIGSLTCVLAIACVSVFLSLSFRSNIPVPPAAYCSSARPRHGTRAPLPRLLTHPCAVQKGLHYALYPKGMIHTLRKEKTEACSDRKQTNRRRDWSLSSVLSPCPAMHRSAECNASPRLSRKSSGTYLPVPRQNPHRRRKPFPGRFCLCHPEVFPGHAKMQVRPGWVPRGMHEAKRMFVSHRKPFPGAGCIVSCPEAFPGRK